MKDFGNLFTVFGAGIKITITPNRLKPRDSSFRGGYYEQKILGILFRFLENYKQ